jgi:hypothetical protein
MNNFFWWKVILHESSTEKWKKGLLFTFNERVNKRINHSAAEIWEVKQSKAHCTEFVFEVKESMWSELCMYLVCLNKQ